MLLFKIFLTGEERGVKRKFGPYSVEEIFIEAEYDKVSG